MDKKLIEITWQIVKPQVSLNAMSTADIASSLWQTYCTLQKLQRAETAGIGIEFTQPAAGIRQETARGKNVWRKKKIQKVQGQRRGIRCFYKTQ
jgi:predicted transcriptional regulator